MCFSNEYISKDLPFHNLVDYDVSNEFVSSKLRIQNLMNENGFQDFMRNNKLNKIFNYKSPDICGYYDEDMIEKLNNNPDTSLNILSLNIRSLPKHDGVLTCLLDILKMHYQVIVLTEIGSRNLTTVEHLMPNYSFIYDIPENNQKGGVGIYFSDSLKSVSQEDKVNKTCECSECEIESACINFIFGQSKYTIAGIYRHPGGKVPHFVHDLECFISKLDKTRTCILAGDININIINYDGKNEINYLTMLLSSRFLPHIIVPSRITDTSATCIDHIFVRKSYKDNHIQSKAGLIYSDISDHLPCFISLCTQREHGLDRPWTRIFVEKNNAIFIQTLSSTNWDDVYKNSPKKICTVYM